jgi:signal transduction histidine kinase
MWIIPVIIVAIISVYTGTYEADNISSNQFLIIIILLGISSFMVYYVVIKMVVKTETGIALAAEKAALDNLSKIKSAFIADISHEIKSPLGIMSGYAELAKLRIDEGTANEDTKENLRVISEEAHRLAQLVERLLNISASSEDAAIPLPIPVGDIVSRAVAVLTPVLAANNNRLDINVEENPPLVAANADMLLQVLFNLGGNANRHCRNSVIELKVDNSEGFVTFTITDKGTGIPPHVLSKIFERGVSGGNSSGLGLPICKEAVEAYGGSIRIESKQGKGTVAGFSLPIYEKQEETQ